MSVVFLVILLSGGGTAFAASQSAKPGITIQISPASRSIDSGQPADFSISVSSSNGFAGPISLGVSTKDLPSGASVALLPAAVTLTSGGTAASTLTVTTSSSTPPGTYSLTVTGIGDKVSGAVTAVLTVNAPTSSSFSMAVTPASVTKAPGASAVYGIQLNRTNFPRAISFTVASGLPSGATATFTPSTTTGNSSVLQVTTTAGTPAGSYSLILVGSGPNSRGTIQFAYASVQLMISTTGKQFTISGTLPGLLAPGTSRSLDLTVSNPNRTALSVSNLTVTVQSVSRTADAIARNLPCMTADYAVTQYSGPYPLTVPGNGSSSLSKLGVSSSAWPTVAMLNTKVNQDGCKGAVLTLAYSGSGQGS